MNHSTAATERSRIKAEAMEARIVDQEPKGWNPYIAGALAGALIVLSVLLAQRYFGASTAFVRLAGMIEDFIFPGRTAQTEYFMLFEPQVDWQWMFVAGIFFGSLLSSLTSRSFRFQVVPDMWRNRFGDSASLRAVVAFLGGVVAMFGARLADG